jgi:hypothetical protein
MTHVPIGPDPRDASDSAPEGGASSVSPASEINGRRRRTRARSVLLAVALVAVWGEVLFDATVRTLVLGMGVAIGCAVGLMAAAMALGLLGFGLFALFDRASAWVVRAHRWPEE